jgi:hypothetical protein
MHVFSPTANTSLTRGLSWEERASVIVAKWKHLLSTKIVVEKFCTNPTALNAPKLPAILVFDGRLKKLPKRQQLSLQLCLELSQIFSCLVESVIQRVHERKSRQSTVVDVYRFLEK